MAQSANLPRTLSFTEDSLPIAIGNLFRMNNYDVEYDVHVHGAQIDIVATSKGDPFSKPVYIEATIEYVSTEKYGKDTTKFLLLARKDPGCSLLCVSSQGFTASVKERAKESGVIASSYEDLFAKFEKFKPYLDKIFNDDSMTVLVQNYEEPVLNDSKGVDDATKWLSRWKKNSSTESNWLIILGEYGTGKTSLTKILQYRWLSEYHSDPSAPIPIRIELKNFSRQFDANGLLHHFLDTNALGHVPIEFMNHLIRTGRVILLMDGYDEMAQFMNNRERRACLSALAELAKDGAKGILTSRPNYFSESEELNVFEALYRKLEQQRYHLSRSDVDLIQREKTIDELIQSYVLDRYERSLQDLTPEQTESLVKRSLKDNAPGQQLVISVLKKIFRDESSGDRLSLSGKPVIITYLLELVTDLQSDSEVIDVNELTEWQIYKLIIDRLMLRDFNRSPLSPSERRRALQDLAIQLSSRGVLVASEETFMAIIDRQFGREFRRLPPEDRRTRRIELFEDLRSSATLTRTNGEREEGWTFSHNSLREFLAAEAFVSSLLDRDPVDIAIPISDAMRSFVSSMNHEHIVKAWQNLGDLWTKRATDSRLGNHLVLIWDSFKSLKEKNIEALSYLGSSERNILINDVSIKEIDFSIINNGSAKFINASNSALSEIKFDGLSISGSNFNNIIADTVSFRDCDLSASDFESGLLFECDFSGATVTDANFRNLDNDSSLIVLNHDGEAVQISGFLAVGYLNFSGALTSPVADIYIYSHHPKFSILRKICERVSEQRNSQLRGLTQRGEARVDPPFARAAVDKLVSCGWVNIDRNDLVSATPIGRPILHRIAAGEAIAPELVVFLKAQ